MADYRVVCTEKREAHEGLIAVGTSNDGGTAANDRFTVAEVRQKIKEGHRFYTVSLSTGKVATVELWGDQGITTSADGVWDNNLDNLRACEWKR